MDWTWLRSLKERILDTVDKATRSKIMSRVGQRNTGPEMKLRKSLHKAGLRYRLHDKSLPGSPDIVFPKFKSALFVHGCFWHRHGCKATTMPQTNVDYWRNKFDGNIARDRRNIEALQSAGWRVAVVWECALSGGVCSSGCIADEIRVWLKSGNPNTFYVSNMPSYGSGLMKGSA